MDTNIFFYSRLFVSIRGSFRSSSVAALPRCNLGIVVGWDKRPFMSTRETDSRLRPSADQPIPTETHSRGASLPGALRYLVLAIFLVYCILPATWTLTAVTKDSSQILTTFGFWFAIHRISLRTSPICLRSETEFLFVGLAIRWFTPVRFRLVAR
jgi:hypothetical protein